MALNKVLPNLACSVDDPALIPTTRSAPASDSSAARSSAVSRSIRTTISSTCATGSSSSSARTRSTLRRRAAGGRTRATPFPAPTSVVTSSGLPFGGVTGMAMGHDVWTTSPSSPCTDILFMTNGTDVIGIDPRPPIRGRRRPVARAGRSFDARPHRPRVRRHDDARVSTTSGPPTPRATPTSTP